MSIKELIPLGHENIIDRHTLLSLCEQSGLIDKTIKDGNREMQKLIKRARRDCVIISDGAGYYRPTPDEIDQTEAWIRKEDHRAISNNLNTLYAKKYLSDMKAGRLK